MRRYLIAMVTAVLIAPAYASQVHDHVTFDAGEFSSAFGDPTPYPAITGSFDITFDPLTGYQDQSVGISNFVISIPLSSAPVFTYFDPLGISVPSPGPGYFPGELVVGGAQDGAQDVQYNPPTNDFYLQIGDYLNAPTLLGAGYSDANIDAGGGGSLFTSVTGLVTVTAIDIGPPPVTGGTPEPSTWAMMLLGFAGLGYAGYRRTYAPRAALTSA